MQAIKTLSYQTICIFLAVLVCNISFAKNIYVDDEASGANDGTSWENAYVYLQDALADAETAEKPVEIRVAQGTYTPDMGAGQSPGDTSASFKLINRVNLFGGYAGVGDPDTDPDLRDHVRFETILSGHLGYFPSGNPRDCYNVIEATAIYERTLLDGFTITSASSIIMSNNNADPIVTNCIFEGTSENCRGMRNTNSDPIITNCTFTGNITELNGGGMYNNNSDPNLTDCVFIGNSAEQGGGIFSNDSYPKLNNCKFIDNQASMGGGMYNSRGGARVKQCTFSSNSATSWQYYFEGGGALFNEACNLNISNCLFTGNQASKGGGLYCQDNCLVWITNCTFDGNYGRGNALSTGDNNSQSSNINLINCIMWDINNNINNFDNSNIEFTYCKIRTGLPRDKYPLFASPGYWADANDPNIIVVPDEPNAVWIDGDYHLKSEVGRYDPNSGRWVEDDVTSPCIDAGDPNMPVGDEPFPNGVLINMGAYGGTTEASKSYSDIPGVVNVNDDDNGSQVTLRQGQILAVTLESNPTTGYSWAPLEKENSIFELFGDPIYLPAEQDDGTVGSGGWEIYYFKSISAGQETLELIYRRPWETDAEPAKTFSIDVTVN
jgi:predicted outer membrane repeat protein